MTPRSSVSEERTQQILDAAMIVFARSGFHQARMDDIADEAGVSKGTLYWYFDSKDDIILGILERLFDVELEDLEALLTADGTVRERLLTHAAGFVEDVREMADLMPMAYEFYAAAGRRETVRTFLQTYFRSYLDLLVTFIQQGINRGEFRPVGPAEVAVTITALFEGINLLWLADPESVDLESQVQVSMALVLDGLRRERTE